MFYHSGQQLVILTTIWYWRKFRERLAMNNQRSQGFCMERFNLKKLNNVEGREKYRLEVLNRFASLASVAYTILCLPLLLCSAME
jgi:hypothetical protein